jgi:hypothetical protein
MSKCARPGCLIPARSSCSVCDREHYCSSSCQKKDRKAHKSLCPTLKKLSTQEQPFHEVIRINNEILASKKGQDDRVLKHLLSYLEYQFGEKVEGIDYRERADGERISNWKVEVEILHGIHDSLACLYLLNNLLSLINRREMSFPYLERSLSLLNPWLIQLDLDASNRMDNRNVWQMNHVLEALFRTEHNMATVAINRDQLDIAEAHCHRCLAYSRRYGLEGGDKTTFILAALKIYCILPQWQRDYSSSLIFTEECYNLVVEAYDPVHPQVQEAVILINILIQKGDLFDAERYAQVTYGNLRDKKNGIDQEIEAVVNGAYNLTNAICRQKGDLIKVEELARESLRIRSTIYGSNDFRVGNSRNLLTLILATQDKLGDERRGLFERSLAISIRSEGPDGFNTAIGNCNIGGFYHKLASK